MNALSMDDSSVLTAAVTRFATITLSLYNHFDISQFPKHIYISRTVDENHKVKNGSP